MVDGNSVFAVYRMDESEHGIQEFRVVSLTDETGIIDSDRLRSLSMDSLQVTFGEFQALEAAVVKLARLLECRSYICLSLPEYNRLVSDCSDLEMLQESMRKMARPLQDSQYAAEAPSVLPKSIQESDHKKGWIGRIFS